MKQQPPSAPVVRLVLVAASAALALGGLSGCKKKKDIMSGFRKDVKALFPPPPKTSSAIVTDMGSIFRLSITRFDLPYAVPREVSSLWSVLSTRGLSPTTLSRLTVNGIRIGRGSMNRAADLQKLLTDLGATARSKSMVTALQGKPSSISLNRHKSGYTIFTLRDDMTMVGKDHRPGRSLLSVSCSVQPGSAGLVELTFLPQVKTNRRTSTFIKERRGYVVKYLPDVDSFYELIWRIVMSGQDFLVIGPSLAAVSDSSPGHQFLLRESAGRRIATLLLLRAEIAGSSATR